VEVAAAETTMTVAAFMATKRPKKQEIMCIQEYI
jgi:hypothetical protein